jgi:uncharacterized damage-inducible protein DinB
MKVYHAVSSAFAALALCAVAVPAAAQSTPAGLRGELIGDITQLEQKYVGLADALTAHYGWRPAEGVRSTSEVLGHVSAANFLIPAMIGTPAPTDLPGGPELMDMASAIERTTDPAAVRSHLTRSFDHARSVIASTPDADLDQTVTLFGRETTRRAALTLLVSHMHEHLGQLIAYARSNSVTPPWSGDE